MSEPTRPVLRYFGGKWLLAPWIISHFPPHRVYVEPFGGGASVLMRKLPSDLEVYNDLNSDIVNVFRVLRDPALAKSLEDHVRMTPYARDEYNLSYERTDDPVEQARRTVIRAFVGFGSNGANRINQKTGFRQRLDIRFDEYADSIPAFVNRLKHVIIENKDAMELMGNLDAADALHFVDPPYVRSTRGKSYDRYEHELTDEQHVALCESLKALKGFVVLCGYPNEIYDRLGWLKVEKAAQADFGRETTEVLWLNPAAEKAQTQMALFPGGAA